MPTKKPIWPLDTTVEMQKFYGRPGGASGAHLDTEWAAKNLVRIPVPWVLFYDKKPVKTIQIHQRCADSLNRVLQAIWNDYGRKQDVIESARLHLYGGSFNFRPIRGGRKLSCHAYGCAIDFDPAGKPLGKPGSFPIPVVAAFEDEGWTYGGEWKNRPDPMHFQAAGE